MKCKKKYERKLKKAEKEAQAFLKTNFRDFSEAAYNVVIFVIIILP